MTIASLGQDSIEKSVDLCQTKHEISNIAEYFEIKETVDLILRQGYHRIALQFPDGLLPYSSSVAELLTTRTLQSVYILADTSYGSCCVDQVAARHVDADLIVHYGSACMSPSTGTAVYYVHGREDADCGQVAAAIAAELQSLDSSTPVRLVYDYCFGHLIEQIASEIAVLTGLQSISAEKPTKWVLSTESASCESSSECVASASSSQCASGASQPCHMDSCGRVSDSHLRSSKGEPCEQESCCRNPIKSPLSSVASTNQQEITSTLHKFQSLQLNSSTVIVYIGKSGYSLSSLLISHHQHQVYSCNPYTLECKLQVSSMNKFFMKRYFLVQKAREAQVIGIVVGTLGIGKQQADKESRMMNLFRNCRLTARFTTLQ